MNKYVSFLYHNHLNDVIELCLKRLKEGNHFISFSIFPIFTESKELLKNEVEYFLNALMKNQGIDEIRMLISEMQLGNRSFKPDLTDIQSILYNRKFILLDFLNNYTKDAEELIRLVKDIEKSFHDQEMYAVASMEEFRKKALDKFKLLFDNTESLAHLAHCELDYIKGTIKCSKEFYEIFGIAHQTKLSFDLLKHMTIYENGFDPFSETLTQKFTDGKPNFHEFKVRRNDQEIRTIYSEDFPLEDNEGKIIGLRRVVQDVTQLRNLESEIGKEESLLKRIFENLPILIGIYDVDENRLVYANYATRELFEFASEYIYESKFTTVIENILTHEDKGKLHNSILEYPDTNEDSYPALEYKVILPNNRNIWFYFKAIVFKRENEHVKEVLISAVDITSLKETEEKLKLNEEKLILAQKIAKVGSYDWNIEKGTSIISEDLVEIYGLPSGTKSFHYPEFIKIVRSDFQPKMNENMNQIINGTMDFLEDEIVIVMPNKSEKDVLSKSHIYRNSLGHPYRVIGTIMDITSIKENERKIEKKNKELQQAYVNLESIQNKLEENNIELERRVANRTQELKNINERYEVFIKQSSIGLCRFEFKDITFIDTTLSIQEQVELISKHIHIAEVNDCLVNILGVENQQKLIGHRLREFVEISDQHLNLKIQKAIQSDYKIREIEALGKHTKEKPVYLHMKIEGVVENGKLIRAWGIITDISARKYSEIALRESEHRYKTLSEAIPGFTWTALPDGKNDYINKRWFDYTGASYEKSRDWKWLEFIHPDEVEITLTRWKNCLESGDIYENEYRIRRFDGIYRWYQVRAIPIKNNNDKITKWIGIQTDIDDKKRSEEKLKQQNEDLDNFIYMVSHDLKAPVSNIEGLVSVMHGLLDEKNINKEGITDILKMIESSIGKFRNNLFELIEIAKSQKTSTENSEDIYLANILKEVKAMLEEPIKKYNAIIKEDFSEIPTIKFAKKNLQSILHNLISNAIKYHSPNRIPEIFINTRLEENYIVLSVKDNGLGLEKEQADKIFSEFKRLHKDVEGSGVGLYLVKRIITNSGGKIEVESENGKGSVFKVYFKSNNQKA
ncbi:phytochrome-like protein cph1 [Sporocytophaga myxococcoides]|uniref:histidine kinase n=1 Tax=Sporocytophaga myxococcoides TaxID=153721 RepID=A0A098LIH1_9BACT|nr:PAS domain-containing protein [Sporocytophaga myxococcoides]GAL85973.1 phytochrome-like protein cph1 [Sporocytophaga myxococcoides]